MIKRSPSRNPRSKGIKVKHVLQVCLLLGVCFWLIYQVKRSHDKKKDLDEKDSSLSEKTLSHDVLRTLGRKGLHPGLQDKTSEKNEEEDTGVGEEENKKEENRHEKEEEEESKHEEEGEQEGGGSKDEEMEREEHMHEEEEKGGEGTGHLDKEKEEQIEHEEDEQNEEANSEETNEEGGDDEVDEGDRGKIEGEADLDGESMDEEKEREDGGEKKESQGTEGEGKEFQGNEDEDREVQTDDETQSEDQDHDGSGKSSHVAREEHYKADDASSAVTHDTQIISTEPEKEDLEKSNENLAADDLLQEKHSINGNPLDVNGDKNNSMSLLEQAENGHPLNVTTDEKKNDEITLAKSEDESPNSTTVTVLSSDRSLPSNKSTEVSTEAGNNQASANLEVPCTSQQNGMLNVSDSSQVQNATVDGQVTGNVANLQTTQSEQVNNGIVSESIQSGSNSTVFGQTENADSFGNDSSNSSSSSESGVSDKIIKPEVTAAEDVNSRLSSGTNEAKEATRDEDPDTKHESGGADENMNSYTTNATGDTVVHDPIDFSDSSIGQDEREARIDLGTLPDTVTGGFDNGNGAEE